MSEIDVPEQVSLWSVEEALAETGGTHEELLDDLDRSAMPPYNPPFTFGAPVSFSRTERIFLGIAMDNTYRMSAIHFEWSTRAPSHILARQITGSTPASVRRSGNATLAFYGRYYGFSEAADPTQHFIYLRQQSLEAVLKKVIELTQFIEAVPLQESWIALRFAFYRFRPAHNKMSLVHIGAGLVKKLQTKVGKFSRHFCGFAAQLSQMSPSTDFHVDLGWHSDLAGAPSSSPTLSALWSRLKRWLNSVRDSLRTCRSM